MDAALIDTLLTDLVRFEIAAFERSRIVSGPRSLAAAELAAKREHALQDVLREAIFLRNWDIARAPLLAVAERLGVDMPLEGDAWIHLAVEATRALIDISQERVRRDRGQFDTPSIFFRRGLKAIEASRDEGSQQTSAEQVAPAGFASISGGGHAQLDVPPPVRPSIRTEQDASLHDIAPMVAEPVSHGSTDTACRVADAVTASSATSDQNPIAEGRTCPRLSEAFELYGKARSDGLRGKHLEELPNKAKGMSYQKNSLPNLQGTGRIMVGLLGDIPVSSLTRSMLIEAFTLMQQLAANHGKSRSEERDLKTIINHTNAKAEEDRIRIQAKMRREGASEGNIEAALHNAQIPRLRVATVYRHMQDVQRVIRFMQVHEHLADNLMRGVIWSTDIKEELETLQEDNARETWGDKLPELYRTPVFQGHIDDAGDPLFWAPLIAPHSSMRAEEALQLRVGDIKIEDGIPFFDLKVGPGQHLKSRAATRRIPVHGNLIALGLLELVELRRRQGEDRLFPHVKRGKTRKALSETFTVDFTEYRRKHGVYEKSRDFHSFRKHFNLALIRARVDSEVRHVLMGHELDSINLRHYGGDGYGLDYLRDCVNHVEIDISMIRSPMKSVEHSKVASLVSTRAQLAMA